MDKTCGICRGPHFTADCPNQQHISRGNTRVETDPTILTRQVADKPLPKRPTPWDPKPVTKPVTLAVTKPVTVTAPVTECQDCIRLRNKIAALEAELKLAGKRSKKPPLTPAERVRRHRQRQAAKAHPAHVKPT